MARWADELTTRERGELGEWNKRKTAHSSASVDSMLTEFGHYFGWEGVMSAIRGEITASMFLRLLREGRRQERFRSAILLSDMRTGVVTGLSKKGRTELQKVVKERTKNG